MNNTSESNQTARIQKFLRIARPFFMIVGAGIILLLAFKTGWSNFWGTLKNLSPVYVLAAVIAWIANLLVAAQRFRNLTAPHLGYFKVFEIILISYLVNYASMVQGVGAGARAGLLKGERVEIARSVAGTGAEVIFDLMFTSAVTLIFALLFGLTNVGFGKIHLWPLVLGAALGASVLVAILIFHKRISFLQRLFIGLKEAMSLKRLLPNLIYTSIIWLLSAISYYCLITGTGYRINPFLALAAISAGNVVGLVSLVPGGLGVRDYVWAYVCSLSGIPMGAPFAAGVFMRVMYIAVVAILVLAIGVYRRWSR